MAQHLQYLEVAVTQDKIPVTYRLLSRHADINVNAAKKLLYQFFSTTTHNVSATYCIIGEGLATLPANEPTQTVRIVDAEDLEVTANADIKKVPLQDLSRYGVIRDNNIIESQSRVSPSAPQSQKAPAKLQKSKSEVKPKTVPASTAEKQEKPIAKPETEQSKPERNKIASMFSAAQKSQTVAKAPAKPKTETIPKPSNTKKLNKIQSDSEDENEEDEEEMDRRLAMSSLQAQAAEEFWKDDEEMGIEKEGNKEEKQADVIDDEPIESDKAEDKEVVPAATEMVEEQNAETPRDRRRLKRKVLKKRHYKDEKGFLVTEDAYEWESYSEDETNEPVLKRKAPPTSPAKNESKKSAKKGGAADQKSLLSFWGKK
ncbi:CDC27 protein [Umbelopsis sp. WA50703]